MRDAYRSLLIVFGAVLALGIILIFWPFSTTSRVMLSLLVILVSSVGLWQRYRAVQTRTKAGRTFSDDNLPPADFQGAVILVCGDNTPFFTIDAQHRETQQGWYLWVKSADQLPLFAQYLRRVRPDLISHVSVLVAIIPEYHTSVDDFTQSLRQWQRAVLHCRAAFGTLPPLWTVTWISPPSVCTDAEPVWFTCVNDRADIEVYQSAQYSQPLAEWARGSQEGERFSRLSQGLWLDSLLAWQNATLNERLPERQGNIPVMRPCMQGICMTPINGVKGNLWQQHIMSITALAPAVFTSSETVPLPELMLPSLPHCSGISLRTVFWNHAGLLGTVFLALAMLASWTNNQRLVRHIGDRLAAYHHLTGQPVEPKLIAQQRLRAEGELLDKWRSQGAPIGYRLGLYQGLHLMQVIEAAINDWVPPPPPDVTQVKDVPAAKIVRLDSMSLFDSGKSLLKAGSTRMLVNSLVGIKAKPGWLIVVSGHTDNTGNPQQNQTLSLKRAEAVRDWMRDTGDVPESCFAVQGYAASRPVAANDTAEGRALNRRVEISLVPQADACQQPDNTPASSQDDDVSQH